MKRYESLPPFWANRGRRDRQLDEEFGPFWANRGRRRMEQELDLLKGLPFLEPAFKKSYIQVRIFTMFIDGVKKNPFRAGDKY